MNSDLETIARAAATAPVYQLSGVEAIVRGLHRQAELRELVTLETIALPPIPLRRDGSWFVVSLLAVPEVSASQSPTAATELRAPRQAVRWRWPDGTVAEVIDVAQRVTRSGLVSGMPQRLSCKMDRRELAAAESELYRALDALFASAADEVPPSLAALYAKVLPNGAATYYRALFPECSRMVGDFVDTATADAGRDADKEQVLSLLARARAIAVEAANEDVQQRLESIFGELDSGRLPIIVCGEFKRGKSSLINALLDDPALCPVASDIATNVVSIITYGPAKQISVTVGDDDASARTFAIDESELAVYATEAGNPNNDARVRFITIEAPHEMLRSGWVFIDTPGVGGIKAEHAAITHSFLPNAAGALFVSSVEQPLVQPELDFAANVLRHAQHLVVAMTKSDQDPDFSAMVDDARSKLAKALDTAPEALEVVPVSSFAKLRYLRSHSERDLRASNFGALKEVLWNRIGSKAGVILLERSVAQLVFAIETLRITPSAERAACEASSRKQLDTFARELNDAQRALRNVAEQSAEWRKILTRGLEDLQAETITALDRRMREIQHTLETAYAVDPRYLADPSALADRITQDVSLALGLAEKQLRDGMAGVSRTVAESGDLRVLAEHLAEESRSGSAAPFSIARPNVPLPNAPPPQTGRGEASTHIRRIVDVAKEALFSSSPLGVVGGILGGAVGAALTLGAGTVPGIAVGAVVGGAVGKVIGAVTGFKRALERQRFADASAKRAAMLEHVRPLVRESTIVARENLAKTVRDLNRIAADDLQAQIDSKRKSYADASARVAGLSAKTESELKSRLADVDATIQRLDRLSSELDVITKRLDVSSVA